MQSHLGVLKQIFERLVLQTGTLPFRVGVKGSQMKATIVGGPTLWLTKGTHLQLTIVACLGFTVCVFFLCEAQHGGCPFGFPLKPCNKRNQTKTPSPESLDFKYPVFSFWVSCFPINRRRASAAALIFERPVQVFCYH